MQLISAKILKFILLGVFCVLIAAQLVYISQSLATPNQLANIIYKNNIPKECSLRQYEKLVANISDYVHEQNIKTGKKIIALPTFGGDSVSVIIPMRTTPDEVTVTQIRVLLMNSLKRGVSLSDPCYSQQDYAEAMQSGEKSLIMPVINVEVKKNNEMLKILDWAALCFNALIIVYLAASCLRKKQA